MGLANNHALDFGAEALDDCANRLFREQIQAVGIGKRDSNAWSPSLFRARWKKLTLLAINNVGPVAGPQIAMASNRPGLNAAIAGARSHANFVVCLVHWGVENSENITDEQRELARWLIDHGVDLVVGSHPHCVNRSIFIMAAQLRIRSAISCSTAHQRSSRGIAVRYFKSAWTKTRKPRPPA